MNQYKTGKFISQKRKELNLTQEQLAEQLNVSNKTISKWETGKCMPDYSIVQDLCQKLGITVAELMDGEEDSGSIRTYDEDQVIEMLRRIQEVEQKNKHISEFTDGIFILILWLLCYLSANYLYNIFHIGFGILFFVYFGNIIYRKIKEKFCKNKKK